MSANTDDRPTASSEATTEGPDNPAEHIREHVALDKHASPLSAEQHAVPSNPYAEAAPGYLAAGWSPIPLPYGAKAPPPTGTTGYAGAYATEERMATWARGKASNVGLRLPERVLGLDLDAYGAKGGAATYDAAVERLGALPPTWRSSARDDDLVSGIRYYQVPEGRQWADELGAGVEVIHHGHRYAVAPPSLHPEGGEYTWLAPDGLPVVGAVPTVDELPALPEAWVAELDRGDLTERTIKAHLATSDVGSWLGELTDGEPCRSVATLLAAEALHLEQATNQSRHGSALRGTARLVRQGEQGHTGVPGALNALEQTFEDVLAGERDGRAEWARMVSGAVAQVIADPTAEADRGCCPERSTAAEDFASVGLFDATATLKHIQQAAHSRGTSSLALLGYVLGRVLAETPPRVKLPPVIGDAAPLNLGIAVVGGSAAGKSSILGVSRQVLGWPSVEQEAIEFSMGSGEGIAEAFLRDEGTGKAKRKVLIDDPRRILLADEVDQLAATQDRKGSTLASTIRQGVSGSQLGQQNATAERRRRVPSGSYRLMLFVGVQETRSAVLLDDSDAGTPQRFLWLPAKDPTSPREAADVPVWPESLGWQLPTDLPDEIDYPQRIKDEIKQARLDYHHSGEEHDELAGHVRLTRLKVATALALLHGEPAITDQWWELAETLTDLSQAVQAECQRVLDATARERTVAAAVGASRAQEAAEDDEVSRAAKAVLRTAKRADGEWLTPHNARPGTHRLRQHMDAAVEALVLAGQVETEDHEHRGVTTYRLRYVGGKP